MRLICPNCGAQYEVADNVIPASGRDVQCSNCGNTWFQAPSAATPDPGGADLLHDTPDGQAEAQHAAEPASTPDESPAAPDDVPEPVRDGQTLEPTAADRADPAADSFLQDGGATTGTVIEPDAEAEAEARERDGAGNGGDGDAQSAEPTTFMRIQADPAVAGGFPHDIYDEDDQAEPGLAKGAAMRGVGWDAPLDTSARTGSEARSDEDRDPDHRQAQSAGAGTGAAYAASAGLAAGAAGTMPPHVFPAHPDALASGPARRTLPPAIADILREEAAHEEAVRRAESGGLESQPDLGLEVPPKSPGRQPQQEIETQRRLARLRGEASPPVGAPVTVHTGSRRELLPDIDVINSTLRPTSEHDDSEDVQAMQAEARKARGFRTGFAAVLLVAALLTALYSMAPSITAALPAAEPAITSYVAVVDDGRIWLERQMQAVLAWMEA
jgi:predicted Zn finger-like uncharacterized protein